MKFDSLITLARTNGASDLHLEPGLPPAIRVRGALRTAGDALTGRDLLEMAREVIGPEQWPHFLERRSFDVIVNGLPANGGHPMHPFVIDGSGNLFMDVGSATNSSSSFWK